MSELKLIALDGEDLNVISAHLQDAVLKIGDIAYLPYEKRFAALVNRFNWVGALSKANGDDPTTRHRTALRIERITHAQTQNLDLQQKEEILSLLAIQYQQTQDDDPAGYITLLFSGGGAIRLAVECIEMELRDLGGIWAASSQPQHAADETEE